MNQLTDFHFLRPAWLLLIIPLVFIFVWMRRQARLSNPWLTVCDPHLLPHLLVYQKGSERHWPWIFFALSLLVTVIALAGPAWSRLPQAIYRGQLAKIIILDLSPSMLATDLPPNRYTRARYKILDILKQSPEGQIGLIVFSEEPYIVSPLTQDAKTIEGMIPILEPDLMPIQGSNITFALQKANELFQQTNIEKGEILLITSSAPSTTDTTTAAALSKNGFQISVLNVGKENNASALASAGKGLFLNFQNTNEDIEAWITYINQRQQRTFTKKTDDTIPIWEDEGRWLIFPLLFLALIAFYRRWGNI